MERTVIDVLLVVLVSVAAYTDLRRGKVYNILTFPAVASGLIINTLFWGSDGLWNSARAGVLAFALLIIPVALKGIGAGDLKLLVAVGVLEGIEFLVIAFFLSAIFAGAVSAVILAYRRFAFVGIPVVDQSALFRVKTLPYAVAMAAGCLVALYVR